MNNLESHRLLELCDMDIKVSYTFLQLCVDSHPYNNILKIGQSLLNFIKLCHIQSYQNGTGSSLSGTW
jgi:hypothetical protein